MFVPARVSVPLPIFVKPKLPASTDSIDALAVVTLILMLEASESVPPESVAVPSSKVSPPIDCVESTVTVYVPVASLPAEKTAMSPDAQAAIPPEPLTFAFQLFWPAAHVPLGVAPPAPLVEPFMSQYTVADGASRPTIDPHATNASATARLNRARRAHSLW